MKNFAVLIVATLLVSGCTEVEYASHLAKGPNHSVNASDREKYLAQQGNFKVGKPYTVLGQTYTPYETYDYVETGIASWYGPGFHGGRTASGEKYDQREMTAAHRTLQMPSLVRVTNLGNGRSVIVRVNDRGPFSKGRVMDVSELAAKNLGMIGPGTAKVKLELLPMESKAIASAARSGVRTNGVELAMNDSGRLPDSYKQYMSGAAVNTAPIQGAYVKTPEGNVQGHMKNGNFYPDPVVTQGPIVPSNIYVQAGAFGNPDNAQRLSAKLSSLGMPGEVEETQSAGRILYRVRIGPLDSVATADNVLKRVTSAGQSDAIITVH